nr:unnamed protein product [Digitaria exilis]
MERARGEWQVKQNASGGWLAGEMWVCGRASRASMEHEVRRCPSKLQSAQIESCGLWWSAAPADQRDGDRKMHSNDDCRAVGQHGR